MITESKQKAKQKATVQKLPERPNPAPKLSRSIYEANLSNLFKTGAENGLLGKKWTKPIRTAKTCQTGHQIGHHHRHQA